MLLWRVADVGTDDHVEEVDDLEGVVLLLLLLLMVMILVVVKTVEVAVYFEKVEVAVYVAVVVDVRLVEVVDLMMEEVDVVVKQQD